MTKIVPSPSPSPALASLSIIVSPRAGRASVAVDSAADLGQAGPGIGPASHPELHASDGISRAWRMLWRSRLFVLAVAVGSAAGLGVSSGVRQIVDPANVSESFGRVGNLLAAAAVRWDGVWYLKIAHGGYRSLAATRFFPLYPALIHVVSWLTGSEVIAGVLVSLAAGFGALVLLHRLTTIELGSRVADVAVDLLAFGPLALYLSAVYAEGLFVALGVATMLAARRERWALAGAIGALAALTRVNGVLLVVPVVVMFLYGPRSAPGAVAAPVRRFAPRHRPTRSLLGAGLIPCGTMLYSGYLWLAGYGPLAYLHAQTRLLRHELLFPLLTVARGAQIAWLQLTLGLSGRAGVLVPHARTLLTSSQSFVGLLVLLVALAALPLLARRLPIAYAAYLAAGLLVPLSSPTVGNPLAGLARYESALFPLYMVAALWAVERGTRRQVLLVSVLLLAFFTAQFATWHVVGSQMI